MNERDRPWHFDVVVHLCTELSPYSCGAYNSVTAGTMQGILAQRAKVGSRGGLMYRGPAHVPSCGVAALPLPPSSLYVVKHRQPWVPDVSNHHCEPPSRPRRHVYVDRPDRLTLSSWIHLSTWSARLHLSFDHHHPFSLQAEKAVWELREDSRRLRRRLTGLSIRVSGRIKGGKGGKNELVDK